MWPFDDRKIRKLSPFVAYMRGRVRPVLSTEEVQRYMTGDLPVLVGFVLGSIAAESEAPLPAEAEVDAEVARRLLHESATPASTPPAVPVAVDAEETQRVRPAQWVGEPLPSVGQ